MRPATVRFEKGVIVSIGDGDADVDLGDLVIMPGLVDSHVHVNEPGRTDWEGFATATRAAVAGGTTSIVDMPLNSIPPTTTVAALEQKRHAAQGQLSADVAFWGGIVPGSRDSARPLVEAGVCG
ncbi:MAG: amidohydrolase family protein, partial [Acidimicrobiia bacterium]